MTTDFENNSFLSKIKLTLKQNFTKKNSLKRLLFFCISAVIVIVCSWPMHTFAMNAKNSHYGNGFIQIDIALNPGIAFSILENKVAAIFCLQGLIILILSVFLVFSNKWYYTLFVGFAETGALFNFFDRMITKNPVSISGNKWCVLDYFHLSFGKTSFNFPDMFILFGVISASIIVTVFAIVNGIKDYKNKKVNKMVINKPSLDIVFEDNNYIIVNKPKKMLVHPTKYEDKDTVIDFLRPKINVQEFEDSLRPGIIQRLDRDTNGLMVVAKNKKTADNLIKQINENTFIKKYYALVHNDFKDDEIIIKAPIIRSSNNTTKMVVSDDPKAKDAITEVKVIEHYKTSAFIECKLLTGRTHQIRVHMNYIHHPIYNDPLYGQNDGYENYGQFLTSYYLEFISPTTNEVVKYTINLDETFNKLKEQLKLM